MYVCMYVCMCVLNCVCVFINVNLCTRITAMGLGLGKNHKYLQEACTYVCMYLYM